VLPQFINSQLSAIICNYLQLSKKPMDSDTPFIVAVKNKDYKTVHKLIEAKVDINQTTVAQYHFHRDLETALHLSVGRFRSDSITQLLIEHGIDMNGPHGPKGIPLETAVAYRNNFAISALLENGVKLTPNMISYLVRAGSVEIAPILAACQDLNTQSCGVSMLCMASWGGNVETMKLLLRYGAAPSLFFSKDGTTLYESMPSNCFRNKSEAMEILANAEQKFGRPLPKS
jgi:ankyrin repeat protein